MNIYEKLLNITNEIKNVSKNLEVGIGQNRYNAVGEADVLHAVKQLEEKYKVYSFPAKRTVIYDAILATEKEYKGTITKGNQIFLRIETIYKFVNVEKPEEFIEITTYGDGIDTQDKAPGKAMTYSDKYALLKAYKIITGDDPDQGVSPERAEYKNKKEPKKEQEPQKVEEEPDVFETLCDEATQKKICKMLIAKFGKDNAQTKFAEICKHFKIKAQKTAELNIIEADVILNFLDGVKNET